MTWPMAVKYSVIVDMFSLINKDRNKIHSDTSTFHGTYLSTQKIITPTPWAWIQSRAHGATSQPSA